jgi:hypothetical protein
MATVIEGYSFSQRTQYEEIENAAREAGRGQWKSHTSVVLGENSVAEEETSHTDFSALRISEVYASPASGEAEWIEIENTGDEPIVLKGLFLDDVEGGSKPWAFPDTVLDEHAFLVLTASDTKLALNNGGDDVRLVLSDNTVLDTVTYPSLKTGQSYARRVDNEWCVTVQPTLEASNLCLIPTTTAKKTASSKSSKAKVTAAKTTVKAKYVNVTSSGPASALATDGRSGSGSQNLSGAVMTAVQGLVLAGDLSNTVPSDTSVSSGLSLADYILVGLLVLSGIGYGSYTWWHRVRPLKIRKTKRR